MIVEEEVGIPVCILVEHVMPFMDDRKTWNNMSMTCRYIRDSAKEMIKRPWPSTLSLPKSSHHAMVSSIAFSPNGRYVACGSISQINVWDRLYGPVLQLRHPLRGFITSLKFSHDSECIAVCPSDSNPIIWNIIANETIEIPLFESDGDRAKEIIFLENDGSNNKVNSTGRGFKRRNETLICASSKGIWKYDLRSNACRQTFSLGVARWYTHLLSVDVSSSTLSSSRKKNRNGQWLATSEDHAGVVKLVNTSNGKRVIIRHNADFINDVAFSPSLVATGGDHGIVQIWNRMNGELVERLYGLISHVNSVTFHPDGVTVAAADSTGRILVSGSTGDFCTKASSKSINKVAFSPDGSVLAATGNDGTLRFLSRSSWECTSDDNTKE